MKFKAGDRVLVDRIYPGTVIGNHYGIISPYCVRIDETDPPYVGYYKEDRLTKLVQSARLGRNSK